VTNPHQLEVILRHRLPNGYNSFWLSHEAKYPAVSLLAKGNLACVYYFPEEGHPGFQSVSEPPIVAQELFEFRVETPDQVQPIIGEAVIPFERASAAAQEFLILPLQPTSLDWREL
jgi:hypothetical protein